MGRKISSTTTAIASRALLTREEALRLLALKLVTNIAVVYEVVREIESVRFFGFLEVLLPKDLFARVRRLVKKRPDLGFVDREEEFGREAIRRFLHRSHTSLEGPGQQLW